jgi:hypothetical protein
MKSHHSRSRQSVLLALVVACVCSLDSVQSRMIPRIVQHLPETTRPSHRNVATILALRGGKSATKADATTTTPSSKKKSKGKKSKKKTKAPAEEDPAADDEATDVTEEPTTTSSSSKQAIDIAMKEKDASEALGDAIR